MLIIRQYYCSQFLIYLSYFRLSKSTWCCSPPLSYGVYANCYDPYIPDTARVSSIQLATRITIQSAITRYNSTYTATCPCCRERGGGRYCSRLRTNKLVADCVLQGALASAYRRHANRNFNSIFMNDSLRLLFYKDNLYSPSHGRS